MPPTRKVSARQCELLVKFAETHRDIAMGRCPGGSLASQAARQAWQSIAPQLNAVEEGVHKTAAQWRRYWIEIKAKVKSKAADSRRMARHTGEGPTRLVPLTPAEKKILALVGPVAVKQFRGVPAPFKVSVRALSSMKAVEEDSLSIDLTPDSGRPSVETIDERDSTAASPEAPSLQVNPLEEDQDSQPEDWAILTVEDQATQWEDNVASQSNQLRQNIDQDMKLPSWAQQLEARWLAIEERNAAALTRIAEASERQTATLQQQTAALQQQTAALQQQTAALQQQTAALQRVVDGFTVTQTGRLMGDPGGNQ
ncbi:uncharacterized protein LOC123866496 [Maniola jurtina]|uniref:uncharacterized protein LOC123866496 n=1 Tax=Maniola jurtina TaxID=191418 RepID=UPI001E688D00|nr:uncharacterized protein LOC123866496 [Maniola jurtina]XP_045764086.1 uncharacterized protein LOC123866496 [Maniola jurtina]